MTEPKFGKNLSGRRRLTKNPRPEKISPPERQKRN